MAPPLHPVPQRAHWVVLIVSPVPAPTGRPEAARVPPPRSSELSRVLSAQRGSLLHRPATRRAGLTCCPLPAVPLSSSQPLRAVSRTDQSTTSRRAACCRYSCRAVQRFLEPVQLTAESEPGPAVLFTLRSPAAHLAVLCSDGDMTSINIPCCELPEVVVVFSCRADVMMCDF